MICFLVKASNRVSLILNRGTDMYKYNHTLHAAREWLGTNYLPDILAENSTTRATWANNSAWNGQMWMIGIKNLEQSIGGSDGHGNAKRQLIVWTAIARRYVFVTCIVLFSLSLSLFLFEIMNCTTVCCFALSLTYRAHHHRYVLNCPFISIIIYNNNIQYLH